MKIVIALNGDGHFEAAPYAEREKVINVLFSIMDGDHVTNMLQSELSEDDRYDFENFESISELKWKQLIYKFEQRGTMEIVEI